LDIALRYRLSRMSDADARLRLDDLASKHALAVGEADEARAIGDRLDVTVVIERLELRVGSTWEVVERRNSS
jgi:hypothetical protein